MISRSPNSMATNHYRALFHLVPRVSPIPFLYETATLRSRSLPLNRPIPYRFQRQQSTINSSRPQDESAGQPSENSTRESHEETSPSAQSDIEANDAPQRNGSFLRRRAAAVSLATAKRDQPERPPIRTKTMTSSERKTIKDLLSQLEDQGIPVADEFTEGTPGEGWSGPSPIRFAEGKDLRKDSSRRSPQTKKGPEIDEFDESDESEKAEDVLADLYKLQLSDLGMADPNNPSEDRLVSIAEAMDLVANREMKKIEAALFQALDDKGDAGVWEVCEQRIFSMLSILETPQSPATSGLLEAWPEPSGEATSSDHLDIPALLSPNLIVNRIYPNALLVAFRVLSTHFPKSPIIDEFRSAIKTKSPTSAFLSTTQLLMADMIQFYWSQRQDLPAVVSFLRDMHNCAVEPISATASLIRDIHAEHENQMASTRELGAALHPFWDLPPTRKAYKELTQRGGWMDKMKIHPRNSIVRRYGLTFPPLE